MAPVCVDCQIEMRCIKNAIVMELMCSDRPYRKFHADKWGCPNCSIEVVVGFAFKPSAEASLPGYHLEPADLRFWGSLEDRERAVDIYGSGVLRVILPAHPNAAAMDAVDLEAQ